MCTRKQKYNKYFVLNKVNLQEYGNLVFLSILKAVYKSIGKGDFYLFYYFYKLLYYMYIFTEIYFTYNIV